MHRPLVATLVLVLVASAARADAHLPQPTNYNSAEYEKVIQLPTETIALDDKQKETVKIGVRWYLFKLTSPTVHAKESEMYKAVYLCETMLKDAFKKDKDAFVRAPAVRTEVVAQILDAAAKSILDNKEQPNITLINTAMVLATTADMSGDEQLLEYLCDLVAQPDRIDPVRYYACRGIRSILEAANQKTPPGIGKEATKLKAHKTLTDFITRKSPLLAKAPDDEVEGIRILRREAVKALAEAREPGTLKNNPVAVTLAKVVSSSGLDPTTRLDERVEAAIGLMQLNPKNTDFQVQAAAIHVGHFLNHFNATFADRKNSGKEPWKIHAARLHDALQLWKNVDDPFVKDLVKEGTVLLKDYEAGKLLRPQDYARILTNKDNAGPLYGKDAASEVKIGQ